MDQNVELPGGCKDVVHHNNVLTVGGCKDVVHNNNVITVSKVCNK